MNEAAPVPDRWTRAIELGADPEERVADLRRELFGLDPVARTVYAVLDAAGIPGLPDLLREHGLPHCCLFSGKLEPGVAEAAPYLVELERESAFTELVFGDGWSEAWGLFATFDGSIGFRDVRRHFRTFLRVRGPKGKVVFFRYYDPRVLRLYVPTCESNELESILGPATRLAVESADGAALLSFERQDQAESSC
ncbi:MAG: DUF4123 domain-containing protein [Planctomycetota bacterium]